MARWYRKRSMYRRNFFSTRSNRFVVLSVLIIALSLYFFKVLEKNLQPTIIQFAESKASMVATETIHRVLYDKVLSNVTYSDLVYVHKDSQQRITMMQANTIRISRILSQANLEIKESLKTLEDQTFEIPIMQAFGSQLLANLGPKITVHIIPIGTVNTKFSDEFQEAGINQVRHILYLDIEANVRIVVPLVTDSVIVKNQIPIAETIIVGQVPNTYFGVDTGFMKEFIENKK